MWNNACAVPRLAEPVLLVPAADDLSDTADRPELDEHRPRHALGRDLTRFTVGCSAGTVFTVVAHLVIGFMIDSASMSCSEPRPLSSVAVAPPKMMSGDCAIWAFFTAVIVFVTPGPAVTAATPIVPVMRATASAANTAFTSSRTSMTRSPLAARP
jgi:hypothetical protein